MKVILLLTILGIIGSFAYPAYDGPALVTQNQNTLRSFGNLGQVSTFSKTINTPFTSVRKADVRISNPGIYAAPTYSHIGYPGLVAHHAVPTIAHTGPLVASSYPHTLVGPQTYVNPGLAAKPAGSLLGVAYSPSTAVSHMTFSNGLGLTYEW